MSVQAITWALAQKTGSSTAKHVLIILANYANEEDACYPSQKLIGEQTELSERAIRSALNVLEERGFIRRETRRRKDGSRTSDLIILCLDRKQPARDRVDQPAKSAGSGDDNRHDVPVPDNRQQAPANRQNMPGLPAAGAGPTGTTRRGILEPSEEPSATTHARRRRTREELDGIEAALVDAAGAAINTTLGTHKDLSAILGCLDNGCDLDMDVLPTIRGRCARLAAGRLRNWSFFTEAICEARDRRLAHLPPQPVGRAPSSPAPRGGNGFAELSRLMDEHDAKRADDHHGITIDATSPRRS